MDKKVDLFNQPLPLQAFYAFGVDPGVNTGVAMWSKEGGLKLFNMTFWEFIFFFEANVIPGLKSGELQCKVVIEANHLNEYVYRDRIDHKNRGTVLRMARNVGMNQNDSKRLCEYMKLREVPLEEYLPTKADRKWSVEYFQTLSGKPTLPSHEHVRDAARFIARYWVDGNKIFKKPSA